MTRATITRFKTVRTLAIAIGLALSTLSFSTASHAYTAEQQRLCTGDAFKFCSEAIPNISAVQACMQQHRSQLSEGCRSVMPK